MYHICMGVNNILNLMVSPFAQLSCVCCVCCFVCVAWVRVCASSPTWCVGFTQTVRQLPIFVLHKTVAWTNVCFGLIILNRASSAGVDVFVPTQVALRIWQILGPCPKPVAALVSGAAVKCFLCNGRLNLLGCSWQISQTKDSNNRSCLFDKVKPLLTRP